MASKKSDMDPNFQNQVSELHNQADNESRQRAAGEQVKHQMPELNGWSGDLFDWDGIQKAFSREKANQDYVKAVSDGKDPGTSGDIIATTLQVEYLSAMERAFRARYCSGFPRAIAHVAALKKQLSEPDGGFRRAVLEPVRGVLKQTSG